MHVTHTSHPIGQILDATVELVRTRGADGWSLVDLAAQAGVPVDAVEAEFESEWEAFCHAMRRDEVRWETAIRETPSRSATERLMHLLQACVPDCDWSFWIELWSLALRDERARAFREELDQDFRALIEEIIRDGVNSGEFSVEDPRSMAITVATLIDTMAFQATLGDTTIRPNYMLDACVSMAGTLLGAKLSLPALGEEAR